MKRSAPLRADPAKTQAWQRRSRRAIPVRGAKAMREADAVAAFRSEVRRRAGGRCQLGAPACSAEAHDGAHAHHVHPSDRDRGVHDPDRGIFCCAYGHFWIHANPAEAEARGWLGRSGHAG